MLKLSSNVNECRPLAAGSGATWAPPLEEYVPREPATQQGGGRKTIQGTPLWGKRVAYNLQLAPGGRSLHSFPFQLNLSFSVHRMIRINS